VTPTCLLANVNPANLTNINNIPTNNQIIQNINQLNQQNDTLAQLIASREALVLPVREQAEASKFQTINPADIPAPSTIQPPPDVQAKIAAKQLTYH